MKKLTKTLRPSVAQLRAYKAHRTMLQAQLNGPATKSVIAALQAKIARYDALLAA
jgi:hypothetical protein